MKLIRFISSNLLVWVVVFAVIAYIFPDLFRIFKPSINWFFATAMFGIGLVLKSEDYRNIFKSPISVLFGTLCQFTIMPGLSFLIGKLMKLPDEWLLGLVIAGSAPGAMTSNVISYLSKADVAYSVSLTTVATMLSPVLTPLITLFLVGRDIPVGFWPMFKTIAYTVVVPLFAGFIIRKIFPKAISRIDDIPSLISVISIVIITSFVVAANVDSISKATGLVLGAVILVNLLGMVLGYYSGNLFAFSFKRKKTLAIEIGMQNAGLGVVLAITHFNSNVAVPAAIFTIWCIISATLFTKIIAKH